MSHVLSQLSQLPKMPRIVTWIGKAQDANEVKRLTKHDSVLAFATVQSIKGLREKLPKGTKEFHLAVIDEAHHYGEKNKWRDWVEKAWRVKSLLGLTATPKRLDRTELPFQTKHDHNITFRSLVEQQILACPTYHAVQTHDLIKGLGAFHKTHAISDFETKGIKHFNQPGRNQLIARDLASRLNIGPTLVFCASKEHADNLEEALKREGVPSGQVRSIHSGDTLKDRDTVQQWFRAERVERRILLNCKLYIEGFDMPDIHTIVLARPTLSPTYWMQMVGRGVRKPESHETFTIIEYVDKYQDRKWGALRASFYLLQDDGLDKWEELYNGDPMVLENGGDRIADWNRKTKQRYNRIIQKLARQSEAA